MGQFPGKTFSTNSKARQIQIARKGGKTVTDKQRLAGYIREAKKWGIKKKSAAKVWVLLQSKELCAVDWYQHIDTLAEMAELEPKLLPLIINSKRDWFKLAHGETIKTENVHHIINWTEDKKLNMISRLLKEGKE